MIRVSNTHTFLVWPLKNPGVSVLDRSCTRLLKNQSAGASRKYIKYLERRLGRRGKAIRDLTGVRRVIPYLFLVNSSLINVKIAEVALEKLGCRLHGSPTTGASGSRVVCFRVKK